MKHSFIMSSRHICIIRVITENTKGDDRLYISKLLVTHTKMMITYD